MAVVGLGIVFCGVGNGGIDGYDSDHPCAGVDHIFARHVDFIDLHFQHDVPCADRMEAA